MVGPSSNIEGWLKRAGSGDAEAERQLAEQIHRELHALARARLRLERGDHSLQPSALVNEAYVRLFGTTRRVWKDHGHFYRMAARVMRNILIDHARRHRARKRPFGAERVELGETLVFAVERSAELLALDLALNELARMDPKLNQLVELRYFGGLTIEETAEVMGISPKSVKRGWQTARAWLGSRVNPAAASAPAADDDKA